MTKEKANMVYDLLIKLANVPKLYKDNFIDYFYKNESGKWRLCGGKLGYNCKYISDYNSVSLATEEETKESIKLAKEINNELSKIK